MLGAAAHAAPRQPVGRRFALGVLRKRYDTHAWCIGREWRFGPYRVSRGAAGPLVS